MAESHQTHNNLPKLKNADPFYEKYKVVNPNGQTRSLDLGCGIKPRNLFSAEASFGIDVRDDLAMGIKSADLVLSPIPFDDQYFDYVTAYDFLEHIPRAVYLPERKLPFVDLMNEIYRVLKPGGIFFLAPQFIPMGRHFVIQPTLISLQMKPLACILMINIDGLRYTGSKAALRF